MSGRPLALSHVAEGLRERSRYTCMSNYGSSFDRPRKHESGDPIIHALANDPSHQAPPHPRRSRVHIRRPLPVMHRRVPLARCSATDIRAFAAYPARVILPSLSSRSSCAHGVHALRRFAPASGERSSLIARAHVPFLQALAPIYFRRVIFHRSLWGKKISANVSGEDCVRPDLASGLHSLCDRPSLAPARHSTSRPSARISHPALGFASLRFADTRSCIRTASKPSESSVPKGLSCALHPLMGLRPSIRLWRMWRSAELPFSVLRN